MAGRSYKSLLVYLIAGTTLARLIYVNFVPLLPQEAYYWKYARHLDLSYFDHPPLTAYVIALFTWVGGDTVFFVRLGAILLSAGLMVLIYAIACRLFKNPRWALLTVLAANCTILFSVGSTIMTPDTPLMFFWAVTVYSLVRLRQTDARETNARESDTRNPGKREPGVQEPVARERGAQEPGPWRWWYVVGLSVGLGLLSKYSAVLIVPGIFAYLLLSPTQRRWLRTPHPYLASCLALLLFGPVIVWNYQNDWASLGFQLPGRFSEMSRLRPDYVGQLFLSQLGLLTPFIFLLVAVGWLRSGRMGLKDKNEKHSLLFWIACPVYVVFTLTSLVRLVKMNWLAPAYVTSAIAGIVWVHSARTKWSERFRRRLRLGLIIGLALTLVAHLAPIVPMFALRTGDTWSGWKELVAQVTQVKTEMGADTFIFGDDYMIPSEITFLTPHHEPTYSGEVIGEEGLQYDYWTDTELLIGRNAIFVTSDARVRISTERLGRHFDSVEEDPPLRIVRGGRVFRIFYIYRCYGYKGPEPEE